MRIQTIILGALLLLVCGTALASETGTITTSDGTVYSDVEYTVDPWGRVISFTYNDATINLAFSKIRTIHDESGTDVTETVLRRTSSEIKASGGGETWQTYDEVQETRTDTLLWSIALSGCGRFDIPVGDYYENIVASFGFGFNMRIALTRRMSLTLNFDKLGLMTSEDLDFKLEDLGYLYTIEHSMDAYRYVIGLEYFPFGSSSNERENFWYSNFGMGAISHTLKATLTSHELATGDETTDELDDEETNFTAYGGFGYVAFVNNSWALDFGCEFNFVAVERDNDDYSYYPEDFIIDFKVSLVKFF